jgi:hypothetical protein
MLSTIFKTEHLSAGSQLVRTASDYNPNRPILMIRIKVTTTTTTTTTVFLRPTNCLVSYKRQIKELDGMFQLDRIEPEFGFKILRFDVSYDEKKKNTVPISPEPFDLRNLLVAGKVTSKLPRIHDGPLISTITSIGAFQDWRVERTR